MLEVADACSLRVDEPRIVEGGALCESFPEHLGRFIMGRHRITHDICLDPFHYVGIEHRTHHKGAHRSVRTELVGDFERQRPPDPLHSLAKSFFVAVAGEPLGHSPRGRSTVTEAQLTSSEARLSSDRLPGNVTFESQQSNDFFS